MKRRKLQLSDLPEPILLYILSKLPDAKQVVRSSVLCTQWRYLWKSVPLSLHFYLRVGYGKKKVADFVASTTRELYYLRPCQNIHSLKVQYPLGYEKHYSKGVDLWIHFATKDANVESFTLEFSSLEGESSYEFPQFAFKNKSLRNLVLSRCVLNPSGSINWTGLVSLSMVQVDLRDGVMERVLSGCGNLESLKLESCDLRRLEISSVKLRELIITSSRNRTNALCLEIVGPYLQTLQLLDDCHEIRLTNVASLVTAVLNLDFHFEGGDEEDNLKKELLCLKELLNCVARVENLELGPWCIKCLSVLELEGWQFMPSSLKFLKLNRALEQWEFPGICSLLQSSSDLEILVIHWDKHYPRDLLSRYTNKDELSRRFETHNFNCTLVHLKTIKFINPFGSLSNEKFVLPFAKYMLKNAIVLEKFIVVGRYKGSHVVSSEYAKMEAELLSFPRSSPQASVIFS